MPRHARIHIPGLPLHIVQRRHNRDACFFTNENYLAYLRMARRSLVSYWLSAAYLCADDQSVNLLLTPPSYVLDFVDRGYAAQALSFPLVQLQPDLEKEELLQVTPSADQHVKLHQDDYCSWILSFFRIMTTYRDQKLYWSLKIELKEANFEF